ncbi:MAG: LytR/AlgR family response regulator transcription factor [Vicinamibacterales bacterium]
MIRTLIVDDEQPARARLRQLLDAHADVEVVGEAEDGLQALEQVAALAPDLILLDIQMPECGGLEVAASLPSPRPALVFCTAYDQYAVDAFELRAADYLLKPVNRARLGEALDRVRHTPRREREHEVDRLTRDEALTPVRFLARKGARYRVVPRADVLAFTFDEGLTRVHTASEQLWMQPTLAALARRLDPAAFLQVSRNAIVNLDAVREAKPYPDGTGEVILQNGLTLPVTRRRWRALIDQLGG